MIITSYLKKYCLPVMSASIVCAYLSGCSSPATLGLNQDQWNRLTPTQQSQFKNNYKNIISNLKQQTKAKPQHNVAIDPTNLPLPTLTITIKNGLAAFPNEFTPLLPFAPLTVTLTPGLCQPSTLYALNNQQHTQLWFCYTNNLVGIDPSFYRMNQAWGTLLFNLNPLWNRGFTYHHLTSTGYARLTNATITIKALGNINLQPKNVDVTQLVTLDPPSNQQ